MRKQRATKKEMLARYKEFLNELMFQIEKYEKVNVPDMIRAHQLKRQVIEVLVGYKVIQNNGRNRWSWNQQITSISDTMSERLWLKTNKLILKRTNESKEKRREIQENTRKYKKENPVIQPELPLDEVQKNVEPNQFEKDLIESRREPKPCPVKESQPRMSLSIFWGLIRIN